MRRFLSLVVTFSRWQWLLVVAFATVEVLFVSQLGLLAVTVPSVFAQGPRGGVDVDRPASPNGGGGGVVQLINPIGVNDPRDLIGRVIAAALGIVGSIALLIFFFGGITWMTAAGNPERVSKGKMIILWAAIGLAVIFTSYALVNFVLTALK